MNVPGGDANGPVPARQISMSVWRNPRVMLGIALILSSALAGGWLLSAARNSSEYWVLRTDVRIGQQVRSADLAPVSARIDSVGASSLIAVDGPAPHGVWARDIASGTLLTQDAVADRSTSGKHLPLRVAVGSLPPGLTVGQRVDVWVGPGPGAASEIQAERLLSSMPVVSVSGADGTGARTVVIDTGSTGPSAQVVAAAVAGHLTLVLVK